MPTKKLKNAPLKEAIFELFWQSPLDPSGIPLDKEFEFALGKFDGFINNRFPVKKRLVPDLSGLKIYGNPIFQFWRGDIIWPVIQLGPGVITVNDTEKNYEWETAYRPDIQLALEGLKSSYSQTPNFNRVTLKYIDSVDVEENTDIYSFLDKNLKTKISRSYNTPGDIYGLNINQSFLTTDNSLVSIGIQTAVNNINGKKAIVWTTSVQKNSKLQYEEILSWLDNAHSITSSLFVEMLNPDFYAQFDK